MGNYATDGWASDKYGSLQEAVDAYEAKIDAIDTGKTIRASGITVIGDGKYFQAWIVYDA